MTENGDIRLVRQSKGPARLTVGQSSLHIVADAVSLIAVFCSERNGPKNVLAAWWSTDTDYRNG